MELRDIPGHPTYKASEDGEIYRTRYGSTYKLKSYIENRRYRRIELSLTKHYVHILIASAWVDNPLRKKFVNHKDGNKLNNHKDNLEWVTSSENMSHAYANGLRKRPEKYVGGSGSKRPVLMMNTNNEVLAEFDSILSAKKSTDIVINGALSGRYKTAGGFVWKYKN